MRERRSGKLEALAKARGITVKQLIGEAIDAEQSIFGAALRLKVQPNTIQVWMARNGYRIERRIALVPIEEQRPS